MTPRNAGSHYDISSLIEGRLRLEGPLRLALRASRIFPVGLIECWGMRASAEKHRCDLAGCFHEMKVLHPEWVALRKYACELDLDKGSYYDGRIGAVNFWCGPDNKPLDWPDVEMDKRTLKFPRDYVGAFFADDLRRRKITLHFCIQAYTRAAAAGVERMSPRYNRVLLGTKHDQRWVMRQFDLLWDHVTLMRKG